ncbi:MAG: hypothetical protein AB1730_00380 [Myxococcota bacterium]
MLAASGAERTEKARGHRAHRSTRPLSRGENLSGVFVVWGRRFGTKASHAHVSTPRRWVRAGLRPE